MELHLKIAGCLSIFLAAIHFFFPNYFKWKQEFISVSLINKQMMYFHTFFLAVVLLMIGFLCLSSPVELIGTLLGKRLILGLAIFWTLRLFIQFFGYSSQLWRGKRFETMMHVLLSVIWIYFSAVYWMIYFS
jgi:hypothetical protein